MVTRRERYKKVNEQISKKSSFLKTLTIKVRIPILSAGL